MLTVHSFKIWVDGTYTVPPAKRTAAQIKQMGGEIVPGTAEEINKADLDDNGRYDPRKRQGKT